MLGVYRGMQGNAGGMHGSGCKVPGKYRGMPGELMRVGAVSGECWGIQGNAKGTYRSGCKLPKDCWDCRGMPRERIGVEAKC